MAMRILWGLVLFLGGCATIGHHETGIDNFDRVSDTLLRGAKPSPRGINSLSASGVKTVINLDDGEDAREAQHVHAAAMNYMHLPMDAESVKMADALRVLKAIESAEAPVFVHCQNGRDRTGLAVATYRVCVQGWTTRAAIDDLNAHGHFWMFFPRVREVVLDLAPTGVAENQ
jgi:tyrosine-protein phosphatase SIW14